MNKGAVLHPDDLGEEIKEMILCEKLTKIVITLDWGTNEDDEDVARIYYE